jgi:acetolactate synthase-1/2/3 large subunit
VFIEELFATLDSNDIVITGNGSACVIGFQAAKLKTGQRLYTNSGHASMGYDLPAAIGACLANEKKRIICLAGDGSLMMNIQELQTLVGYSLPVKIILLNKKLMFSNHKMMFKSKRLMFLSKRLMFINKKTKN